MKNFDGFPANMQCTPIPNLFLSLLMPDMETNELKCVLFIFQAIYSKKGSLRYVSQSELFSNAPLLAGMQSPGKSAAETIEEPLASAVKRGIIIRVEVTNENVREHLYFLNTPSDRRAVEKIRSGYLNLPQIEAVRPAFIPAKQPDIFSLYEENIGMLTPMIAEELKDAQAQYSEEWLRDALREAVYANKRNWRYISRILERWTSEGKKDGTYRQNTSQEDPDRYIRGQYGHLIHR
ncbi:MAG: DnaD domain protein [Dehalococcoidia bacterium]|nr:DnaD domain protein [Dehalococcoidia bacterium]